MNIKNSNTILYCRKWKAVVAFYKTQLKFPVTTFCDWFTEFRLNEASCLSIADASRTSIDTSGGKGITITLEVDDIEAIYSYLEEAGVNPTSIKDHVWGAKVIHIFDPEGNRLEFWSPKVESD